MLLNFHCCGKRHVLKQVVGGKSFNWLRLLHHSIPLREVRVEIQQEPGGKSRSRLLRDAVSWLSINGLFSYNPGHLSRDGTSHSGLTTTPSIITQETALSGFSTCLLDGSNPSGEVAPSQVTRMCAKLTKS